MENTLEAVASLVTRRGLRKFIHDIRQCQSKEAEGIRVEKELAKLRQKFSSTKTLKSYDKKKYVWKLVYIFMLGYNVEFGHMEMVNLASSENPGEKQVGYVALGVLLDGNSELNRLAVNTVRSDLQSGNLFAQCLALHFIGNLGGQEFTGALGSDVVRILQNKETKSLILKKAMFCVKSLLRVNREIVNPSDLIPVLQNSMDQVLYLGLCMASVTMTLYLAETDPEPFLAIIPNALRLLEKIVLQKAIPKNYMYHQVPCPLLQVKLLQLLQKFPIPSSTELDLLVAILRSIFTVEEKVRNVYRSNALHSVLVEAANLVIAYGETLEDIDLHVKSITILGRFISLRDSNIRYLGLKGLAQLAMSAQRDGRSATLGMIRKHQGTVLTSLEDNDASIRRKALDLLFCMCDKSNAPDIIKRLSDYLMTASYDLKAETALKIAILSERYSPDSKSYVDTILHLITTAGDYISDEIWFRVVQIVTNTKDMQLYASTEMYNALQVAHVHETTVKVGAYILGEFGYLLVENHVISSPQALFDCINEHFTHVSSKTRCIMFHAYIKFVHCYPDQLSEDISLLMDAFRDSSDLELQQRACEYFQIPRVFAREKMAKILEPMPEYPEKKAQNEDDDNEEEDEQEEDLLGMQSLPEPVVPPASQPTSVQQQEQPVYGLVQRPPPGKLEEWYRNLLTESKGLLYQDGLIQIGVQQQYQNENGRIMLFFGNKSGVELQNFLVTVPTTEPNLVVKISPVDPIIPAGAQARVSILATLMIPFDVCPVLQVSFTYGASSDVHFVEMKLPVTVTSFATPIEFSSQEFNQKWPNLPPGEEVVVTANDLVGLLKSLGFGVNAIGNGESVAACTIETGTVNSKTQQKAVVGCIMKVRPGVVDIKSVNKITVNAIKTILSGSR